MGQPASWPRFLGESFGPGLAIGGRRPLGLAGFAFATPLLFLARDGSSDTSAGVLLLAD
jgi:succinate-acetate transporter protein